MSIKITTLVENSVYGKGLQGEHGLSLLVDTGEHRLLFDTGASDQTARKYISGASAPGAAILPDDLHADQGEGRF